MAITRAQQVKQMLREGGRIGFKGGADAATESFGKSVGYSGPDGSTGRPDKDFNPGTGGGGPTFGDAKASQLSKDQIKREKEYRNFIQAFNKKPPFVGPTASFLRNLIPGNTKLRGQFINQKLQNERIKDFYENLSNDEKNNFEVMQALNAVGYDQYAADMGSPGLLYSGNVGNLEKFVTGEDAFGNTTYGYKEKTGDGDGMSDYERRLLELEQALKAQAVTPVQTPFAPNLRLLADGGMTEDAPVEGGIMDLESGRQMYFLGKLVKKATRAVKKIVKSPIGKAALFASPLLMSSAARSGLASFLFKNPMAKGSGFGGFMEMLKGGMTGGGKFALGAGLTLAPFLFGNEEEKQQPMYQGADIADPNFIMANYPQFTNPRLAAEGGLMRAAYQEGSKEPVAKKTMPLLDMDGKEMDLREEGGFVPIGRMEKADDVPARLSKNEFVFTADAVRNAGDGNVDKGAEVMYNMMKNLESGGDVSEESQGLEGAREMFQTSQRLEEVL